MNLPKDDGPALDAANVRRSKVEAPENAARDRECCCGDPYYCTWKDCPPCSRESLAASRLRSSEPEVVPTELVVFWRPQHSTRCAITASGHRGPCSCGADLDSPAFRAYMRAGGIRV